jgi:hypothetical protein
MFFLSIVPYALFGYYGSQPTTKLGQAEQSLMNLESTLSSMILSPQQNDSYPGDESSDPIAVRNSTITEIENQMSAKRQEIMESLALGNASSQEAQAFMNRSEQISAQKVGVEIRLRDLSKLSYALDNGIGLNYLVSGVDNADMYSVYEELEQTFEYKSFLNKQGSFWKEVSNIYLKEQQKKSPNSEATKQFEHNMQLSAFAGLERIIGISDLYNSTLAGKGSADVPVPDATGAKMKQDIFYEQQLYLKGLNDSKNKPWYSDIVKTALDRNTDLSAELNKVKETIRQYDEKINAAGSKNYSGTDKLRSEQESYNSLKTSLESEIAFVQEIISGTT